MSVGLRLEYTKYQPITNFFSFLLRIYNFGLFGTGETQISKKDELRTILLDTDPLGLLDFDPPKDDIVFKRSRRAVYNYFGIPIKSKDEDIKDEMASKERRSKIDGC